MASTPELPMGGPDPPSLADKVEVVITEVLSSVRQPSAWELLELLEQKLGWMSRWEVEPILEKAKDDQCHELAHIYLGHLGSDKDHWWSSRSSRTHNTVEIEAEAVAFIVTTRLGLKGSSASYVSSHLKGGTLPDSVSLDQIAKVAGRIEGMSKQDLGPRRERRPADSARSR